MPRSDDKLTPVEMMKLSAGEVAGEKSVKTLAELVDQLEHESDTTKRFGQKGLGQRDLARMINTQRSYAETNEGKCMFSLNVFKAAEEVILDYVQDNTERAKYFDNFEKCKRFIQKTNKNQNV